MNKYFALRWRHEQILSTQINTPLYQFGNALHQPPTSHPPNQTFSLNRIVVKIFRCPHNVRTARSTERGFSAFLLDPFGPFVLILYAQPAGSHRPSFARSAGFVRGRWRSRINWAGTEMPTCLVCLGCCLIECCDKNSLASATLL